MNAATETIATEPGLLDAEWFVHAESDGHLIHGVEIGLERALAVGRGLAVGGWRVKVQCCDPYVRDALVVEMYRAEPL